MRQVLQGGQGCRMFRAEYPQLAFEALAKERLSVGWLIAIQVQCRQFIQRLESLGGVRPRLAAFLIEVLARRGKLLPQGRRITHSPDRDRSAKVAADGHPPVRRYMDFFWAHRRFQVVAFHFLAGVQVPESPFPLRVTGTNGMV